MRAAVPAVFRGEDSFQHSRSAAARTLPLVLLRNFAEAVDSPLLHETLSCDWAHATATGRPTAINHVASFVYRSNNFRLYRRCVSSSWLQISEKSPAQTLLG